MKLIGPRGKAGLETLEQLATDILGDDDIEIDPLKRNHTSCNTIALVLLFAGLLAYLGPALNAADDHSAEWPTSAELQALQATEAGTARREAAGQALCTAERGPQSEARWTPEGDLVCTQRRNTRSTITIMGARL